MLCTITTVLTVVFSVYVGLDGRIQPCLLHVAFSDRRVLLYVLLLHNHSRQIGDHMHDVFGSLLDFHFVCNLVCFVYQVDFVSWIYLCTRYTDELLVLLMY